MHRRGPNLLCSESLTCQTLSQVLNDLTRLKLSSLERDHRLSPPSHFGPAEVENSIDVEANSGMNGKLMVIPSRQETQGSVYSTKSDQPRLMLYTRYRIQMEAFGIPRYPIVRVLADRKDSRTPKMLPKCFRVHTP